MDKDIAIELIRIAPSVLLYLGVLILLLAFRRVFIQKIVPNVKEFSFMGVGAKLISTQLDKANDTWAIKGSANQKKSLMKRIERLGKDKIDLSVLWIDDNPGSLIFENNILSKLGLLVEFAKSSEVALEMIAENDYDLLISDIDRGGNPSEGVSFLAALHEKGYKIPTIFYIGKVDEEKGVPPYAFAITDKPIELIHCVLDIVERKG